MDSWIQALLVITVPLDIAITLFGVYFIKMYSDEQAAVREAAHDAEITAREQLRYNAALVKSGQAGGSGGSDIGQLIEQFAPLLLAKVQGGSQANKEVTNNGKEI